MEAEKKLKKLWENVKQISRKGLRKDSIIEYIFNSAKCFSEENRHQN